MKFIIIILLLFGCAKSQSLLNGIEPVTATLITLSGESNAKGYGQNTLTNAWEQTVSYGKQLNLTTFRFEPYLIGYNTLGGSSALVDTSHGFEMQITKNESDSGLMNRTNLYICKTGEGSTFSTDWEPGDVLYNLMLVRMDSSISKMRREKSSATYNNWLIWSQGINDMAIATSAATWKTRTKTMFAAMKVIYPDLKIVITKFNQPLYTGYNTVIQEIDDELNYVWAVDATSATWRLDETHWDYYGLKTISRRITDIILAN